MRKCFSKLFILFFVVLALTGCEEEKKETKQFYFLDTVVVKPREIKYNYFHFEGLTSLNKLEEEFGKERKKIILALNRLDSKNIKKGDSLIIPDTVFIDIMHYSPFPKHLAILDSVKKFIIFSYPIQAFAAYEFGKLVRWGPTSLGKRSTPTPTGLFHTNWKSKETISTVDSSWILPWAFNLDNFEGVSMHQYDLPGYPASHACCRLLDTDAEWFFYWAEQWILTKDGEKIVAYGTPVIIYGKYDYKNPKPWKNLVKNPKATLVKREELEEISKPFIQTIIKRAEERNSILTASELNR